MSKFLVEPGGGILLCGRERFLDEWWEKLRVLRLDKEYYNMLQTCVTNDTCGEGYLESNVGHKLTMSRFWQLFPTRWWNLGLTMWVLLTIEHIKKKKTHKSMFRL